MRPEPHAKNSQEPAAQKPALPPRCASVQARLFAYLDGDLPPAEREAIRLHLADCAACRREESLCQQSEQALASALSAIPPAGDLRAGFYARLAASNRVPPIWQRWRLALPALAAAVVAVALLLRLPAAKSPAHRTQGPAEAVASTRSSGRNLVANRSAPSSTTQPKVGLKETPARIVSSNMGSPPALAIPRHTPFRPRRRPLRQSRYQMASLMPRHARPVPVRPPVLIASSLNPEALASSAEAEHSLAQMSRQFRSEEAAPSALALPYQEQRLYKAEGLSNSSLMDRIGKKPALKAALIAGKPAPVTPPSEEVSVHIVDEERGFTATTELKTASDARDGGEVITIEADSASR